MMYFTASHFQEEAFVRGFPTNALKKKTRVRVAATGVDADRAELVKDLTQLCYHCLGTPEKFSQLQDDIGPRTRQLREMISKQAADYNDPGGNGLNPHEGWQRLKDNSISFNATLKGKMQVPDLIDQIRQRTERVSSVPHVRPIQDHVSRLSGSELMSRMHEVKDELDKIRTVEDMLPVQTVLRAKELIANPPPRTNWRDEHMEVWAPHMHDGLDMQWSPMRIMETEDVAERHLPADDQWMQIRICLEGAPCRTPIYVRPSFTMEEVKETWIVREGFEEMGPPEWYKMVKWGQKGTPDEMLATGMLRDDSTLRDHGYQHRDLIMMSYRPPPGAVPSADWPRKARSPRGKQ